MGYTHYWRHDHQAPGFTEAFARLQLDCTRIFTWAGDEGIALAGYDPFAGEYRAEVPLQNEGAICFDGVGDEGHETFVLELDPFAECRAHPDHPWSKMILERYATDGRHFTFCKTARKPYDVVVSLVLLRAAAILPAFDVGSDGSWDVEWLNGAQAWDGSEGRGARRIYPELFDQEPLIVPTNRSAA